MSKTTLAASAYLHHVNLRSPEPERLARFYSKTMDMPECRKVDGLWFAGASGRRVLFSEGEARTLGHAGFACRDAEGLGAIRQQAQAAGLATHPFETSLFAQGAFSVQDPDGNEIAFGLAAAGDLPAARLRGPLQHLTLATRDVYAIENFYCDKLGFAVSDHVVNDSGKVMTSFMRSNHEHHTLACFLQDRSGIDHHSYETGEWIGIRDWSDHFADRHIQLMWGPGRHGPGNNLFIFIVDPDGGWIEVSAELEVMHDRPVKSWRHEERTLNLWGKAILRA